jgi:ferredoxin
VLAAPNLFDQDEGDGLVVVRKETLDGGDEVTAARRAIDACPNRTIALR